MSERTIGLLLLLGLLAGISVPAEPAPAGTVRKAAEQAAVKPARGNLSLSGRLGPLPSGRPLAGGIPENPSGRQHRRPGRRRGQGHRRRPGRHRRHRHGLARDPSGRSGEGRRSPGRGQGCRHRHDQPRKTPSSRRSCRRGLRKEDFAAVWIGRTVTTWEALLGERAGRRSTSSPAPTPAAPRRPGPPISAEHQEDLAGIGVYGDPGLAEAVRRDPLAIGFNNVNFAYDAKTLEPVTGLAIGPIDLDGSGAVDPAEKRLRHARRPHPGHRRRRLSLATRPRPLLRRQGETRPAAPRRSSSNGSLSTARRSSPRWATSRVGPDRIASGLALVRGSGGEEMRLLKDALARRAMGLVAALPGLLVLLIVVGLFLKSRAILGVEPLSQLLFSPAWHPLKGEFGLLPFITGTVWVTRDRPGPGRARLAPRRDLPVRIRPARGPRSRQARHRPPGRPAVGRLRRLGSPPRRPLRRRRPGPARSASIPPATASSPAASCWPS